MDSSLQESRPQRVLCVDDDVDIGRVVVHTFEEAGFEAAAANSGAAALEWIERNGLPHVAIVDQRMPGIDGLEFCRRVHVFCDLPIVFLSAVDEEPTVIKALETVAEDYVTKPFRPLELVARVRRVLRRVGDFSFALRRETAIDERLSVDFARQLARVEGQEVSLTPTETKILHILMRSSRRVTGTDFLLRRVWPQEEVFEDTLRVHVHRLRQKIEADPSRPSYIVTSRGHGYSFLPALTEPIS
jgi:DNA-binding response OmpR family regulator